MRDGSPLHVPEVLDQHDDLPDTAASLTQQLLLRLMKIDLKLIWVRSFQCNHEEVLIVDGKSFTIIRSTLYLNILNSILDVNLLLNSVVKIKATGL